MSSLSDFLGGGGGSTGNKTAVTLEAAENITAGNAVCLRSDGKIEKTNSIYPDSLDFSDVVTSIDEKVNHLTTTAMNADGTILVGLSHNTSTCEVQVFDRDSTTGVLTARSTNPLLPDLEGNNAMRSTRYRIKYCANQDVFIVAYASKDSSNTNGRHTLVAIDVPATGAPTIGTPVTSSSSDNSLQYIGGLEIDPDSNKIWLVYGVYGYYYGYNIGYFCSFTVTGTTITSTGVAQFASLSSASEFASTGLVYTGSNIIWAMRLSGQQEYLYKITVNSTTGAYTGGQQYNGHGGTAGGVYAYEPTRDKIIYLSHYVGTSSGFHISVWDNDMYIGNRRSYRLSTSSFGIMKWVGVDPTNGKVYFMNTIGDIRVINDVGTGTEAGASDPAPYNISYSSNVIADTNTTATNNFALGGEDITGATFSLIGWTYTDNDTEIQSVVFNQEEETNWFDFVGVAAEDINSGSSGEVIINGGVAPISTTLANAPSSYVYPFIDGSFTQTSSRNIGGSGIGTNIGKTAVVLRDRITND